MLQHKSPPGTWQFKTSHTIFIYLYTEHLSKLKAERKISLSSRTRLRWVVICLDRLGRGEREKNFHDLFVNLSYLFIVNDRYLIPNLVAKPALLVFQWNLPRSFILTHKHKHWPYWLSGSVWRSEYIHCKKHCNLMAEESLKNKHWRTLRRQKSLNILFNRDTD